MYLKHPNVLFDEPTFLKLREKLVRIDLFLFDSIFIKNKDYFSHAYHISKNYLKYNIKVSL